MKTEIEYLIILNAVPGIGNATARKLLTRFGSAEKIFKLTEKELAASGCLSKKMLESFFAFATDSFLEREQKLIDKHNVQVIACTDEAYPETLREIPDAPLVLYVKGNLSAQDISSIAIVGSRRASIYGLSVARQLAMQLADYDIRVVSGMARGIDTAAHQGIIAAKGNTIAVLGNGLNHIYPAENKNLFDDIVQHGAVISEFSMDTRPKPHNFPRRNRIISGLARGVIVVEAAERSGALITADFALEQGREVYAVPGNINTLTSKGVNHLIKQGAKLMTSLEDVLEDLPALKTRNSVNANANAKPSQEVPSGLSDQEQEIYQRLMQGPIHIDDLLGTTRIAIPQMTSVLLNLEMKKIIKQLPGKIFTRA
ncbi:MAG: DNA-protecting protein DprA [Candidatus Omnitrophica bacterium]|nr:DNA-protecting protein DprA [Candidatus Omnitrophota bacterium]